MRQAQLRHKLTEAMIECLLKEGMPELAGALVLPEDEHDYYGEPSIDKAMDSAYRTTQDALKQISRLAVRLGYLERGQHYNRE